MQSRFTQQDALKVWRALKDLRKRRDVAAMYNISPDEVDMLWRTGERLHKKRENYNQPPQKNTNRPTRLKRPPAIYSNQKK